MEFRVLNFDGSIPQQEGLRRQYRQAEYDLLCWGPLLRRGCGRQRFCEMQVLLDRYLGAPSTPKQPVLTFLGSSDFHHLTLALLQRLREPVNLVVVDARPDWQAGFSAIRAKGWLALAARLPVVRRLLVIGAEHGLGWLGSRRAPWDLLHTGKANVLAARQELHRGSWRQAPQQALRSVPGRPLSPSRLEELLSPYLPDLERWPLYLSLDKSVLTAEHAVVNGKPGPLNLDEVLAILEILLNAAEGNVAGMDVVGDWSPPVGAWYWGQDSAPSIPVSRRDASQINQRTNLAILDLLPVDRSRAERHANARGSHSL